MFYGSLDSAHPRILLAARPRLPRSRTLIPFLCVSLFFSIFQYSFFLSVLLLPIGAIPLFSSSVFSLPQKLNTILFVLQLLWWNFAKLPRCLVHCVTFLRLGDLLLQPQMVSWFFLLNFLEDSSYLAPSWPQSEWTPSGAEITTAGIGVSSWKRFSRVSFIYCEVKKEIKICTCDTIRNGNFYE